MGTDEAGRQRIERLREVMLQRYNGVQARLAAALEIQPDYLSRLLKGKKNLSGDMARVYEERLGLAKYSLDTGIENVEAGPEMRGQVPLISWVQAGAWCEATDPYNVGDAEAWIPCPVKHGPHTYALRVRGESMYNPGSRPSFSDGDIIFCDPDREPSHKSLVIARLDGNMDATFKRLLIDESKRYLEALNPDWPNRIFEISQETSVCGVVIARLESFV